MTILSLHTRQDLQHTEELLSWFNVYGKLPGLWLYIRSSSTKWGKTTLHWSKNERMSTWLLLFVCHFESKDIMCRGIDSTVMATWAYAIRGEHRWTWEFIQLRYFEILVKPVYNPGLPHFPPLPKERMPTCVFVWISLSRITSGLPVKKIIVDQG